LAAIYGEAGDAVDHLPEVLAEEAYDAGKGNNPGLGLRSHAWDGVAAAHQRPEQIKLPLP
jgi:hypothetical protein